MCHIISPVKEFTLVTHIKDGQLTHFDYPIPVYPLVIKKQHFPAHILFIYILSLLNYFPLYL